MNRQEMIDSYFDDEPRTYQIDYQPGYDSGSEEYEKTTFIQAVSKREAEKEFLKWNNPQKIFAIFEA